MVLELSEFVFSRDILSRSGNGTLEDNSYIKKFILEAESRVELNKKILSRIVDRGDFLIDTMEQSRLAMANIRYCTRVLFEGQQIFKLKPGYVIFFDDAYGRAETSLNEAERDFEKIKAWFGY
jgi:hypothetical protein